MGAIIGTVCVCLGAADDYNWFWQWLIVCIAGIVGGAIVGTNIDKLVPIAVSFVGSFTVRKSKKMTKKKHKH